VTCSANLKAEKDEKVLACTGCTVTRRIWFYTIQRN